MDHVGVLVGDGSFPREQSVDRARLIFSAIPSSSKAVALLLSADLRLIEHTILKPAILHLGASTDLLTPPRVQERMVLDVSRRRSKNLEFVLTINF